MSANLYVFDVNPVPSEDVFTLTGISEEYWTIAKIEDQSEVPGGGIGTTSLPFTLTVTSGQGDEAQAISGTWQTDVDISAFQLKAGDYSLFAIIDNPAMSGSWDQQKRKISSNIKINCKGSVNKRRCLFYFLLNAIK